MTELTRIVQEWDDEDPNWDDLLEHDVEDLEQKYQLSRDDAGLLQMIILEQTNDLYNAYGLDDWLAPLVLENIQEGLHQSLDGWTEDQKIVIRAYLADLSYSANLCYRDRSGSGALSDRVASQVALDEGAIDDGLTDDEK